jgi:hypothetical protein
MRVTAEIRWFWRGSIPPDFQAWFVAAGRDWPQGGEPNPRTDSYLCDPAQTELGIKQRGGGIVEIKGLIARQQRVHRFAGQSSHVELWAKWGSHALKLGDAPQLEVRKQRWLRSFDVGAGMTVETRGESVARNAGCDVELTSLTLPDGSAWWTVGFESFGALDRVEADLAKTLAVMAARHPPIVQAGHAAGYPAWLAMVLGSNGTGA